MRHLSRVAILALSMAFVGCGSDPAPGGKDKPDVGPKCAPEKECNGVCCVGTEICNLSTLKCVVPCEPDCRDRECGSDGCNGVCGGACPQGKVCSAAGKCEQCQKESDANFCSRKLVQCGPASGTDNCGEPRSVPNCPPGCAAGRTCVRGVCEDSTCNRDSDGVFCLKAGKQCGPASGTDNCNQPRTVAECGPCPGGQPCSASGQCSCTPDSPQAFCQKAHKACGPAIGTDNCGQRRSVAECGPCGGGLICNAGTCQVPCTSSNCKGPGLSCQDPGTGIPICTCTAQTDRTSDSCSASGKVCTWNSTSTPGVCRLPDDRESCLPSVGCASPQLVCADLLMNQTEYMCLRPCSSPMGCPNRGDTCLPNNPSYYGGYAGKCWYNLCADPQDTRSTPSAERAKYFRPCGVASPTAVDGTCLPEITVNESQTAYVDVGVCYLNGGAPSLGECDPFADKTRLPMVCGAGEECEPVMSNGAGGYRGICRVTCNAAASPSPSRSCGYNQNCRDVSGFPWYYNGSQADGMRNARLGACDSACDPLGTGGCSPDLFANQTGCFPLAPFDGRGYCIALQPGAGGAGQACVPSEDDIRAECGDRLVCDAGVCVGWCNTQTCSNEGVACASCQPAGARCEGLMSSAPQPVVGICTP